MTVRETFPVGTDTGHAHDRLRLLGLPGLLPAPAAIGAAPVSPP